jgi:hypothetical protein
MLHVRTSADCTTYSPETAPAAHGGVSWFIPLWVTLQSSWQRLSPASTGKGHVEPSSGRSLRNENPLVGIQALRAPQSNTNQVVDNLEDTALFFFFFEQGGP